MHEEGKNWNESLNKVQFACNNTYNRSIKNTPSMLLFGLHQHGGTNDYLRKVLDAEHCVDKRDLVNTRQNAKENIRNVQMIKKINVAVCS